MSKYQYTDDMAEISGFGGGYESTCRAMVAAGLRQFIADTGVDEVILSGSTFDPEARKKSFSLVARAFGLTAAQ